MKSIPGFSGYFADVDGSIWSRRSGELRQLTVWPRINTGYLGLQLTGPTGRPVSVTVHRVMAITYLGPRPEGHQVRHLDGDKSNNALSNLLYGTAKENAADTAKHGRQVRGERSPHAKLTAAQVREIRSRYTPGLGRPLAREFGVSQRRVQQIIRGEAWPEAS